MATIKDIANKLGISVSAVSKGLNGASDISEELRQMVLDTAVEMGYSTKRSRKEEHRKLAVFIENMDFEQPSDFGYDIILGFKQNAFRHKWDVEVIPVTPTFQLKEKYDTFMLRGGFSGAFVLGFTLHDEWMKQFETTSTPTALFDNFISKNPCVSYIGTDNYEGIDLAVDHLSSLGHKKIAFLNGSLHSMVSAERQDAFRLSMERHKLEFNSELTAYGYYMAGSAQDHVPAFLDMGATAIMCGNDLIATGVIEECKLRGYKVPEDISVIGFDDIPVAEEVGLTTVNQNRLELGKCGYVALSAMIHKIAISKTLMRPSLIVRDTTSKCKKKAK